MKVPLILLLLLFVILDVHGFLECHKCELSTTETRQYGSRSLTCAQWEKASERERRASAVLCQHDSFCFKMRSSGEIENKTSRATIRGCADKVKTDGSRITAGCDKEKQYSEGVEVTVESCFCNTDYCNEATSSRSPSKMVMGAVVVFTLLVNLC